MVDYLQWLSDNNTMLRYRRQHKVEHSWEKSVNQYWQYQIECGLRRPSIDFLIELSMFFNTSMNYLVFGVHPEDVEKETAKKEIDAAIEKIDQTIEKLLVKKEELLQMKKDL